MSEYNDSYQHVVKTTGQWSDRAVENWVVPRGCLCVELTPSGKTKIKIGEGNKFYRELPYVHDFDMDLSNYYNKQEIDNIIDNLNFMSIASTDVYESKNDLPKRGNKLGDVRFVKNPNPSISTDPIEYLWNGKKWIPLGSDAIYDIDLSDYVKKKDIIPRVEKLEEMAHTHDNKEVLDQVDDPWTKEDREKLDGLKNYDDSELREMIENMKGSNHTHDNKDILDQTTDPWTEEDRKKFDSLENYDDTELTERIEILERNSHTHDNKEVLDNLNQDVIDNSHTHKNKEILDQIEAAYTNDEKKKLASLHPYEDFVGTDGYIDGENGLVPKPKRTDKHKFLSSDGTWADPPTATDYIGASEEYDGYHGLVPAAMAGEQDKFLKGDGTWTDPSEVSVQIATKERPGIVQVGEHLTITDEGILDVDPSIISGVIDVDGKEDSIGVIVVTTNEGDKEVDLLKDLGKLTFNCNNDPE